MISAKLMGALALMVAIAFSGWQARGWFEDSQVLTAERVARQMIEAEMSRESEVARVVEHQLARLEPSERVIDRGIIREIQKPIYQRVCLEPEFVRLLNTAATGQAAGLSAEHADSVPAAAAAAD